MYGVATVPELQQRGEQREEVAAGGGRIGEDRGHGGSG